MSQPLRFISAPLRWSSYLLIPKNPAPFGLLVAACLLLAGCDVESPDVPRPTATPSPGGAAPQPTTATLPAPPSFVEEPATLDLDATLQRAKRPLIVLSGEADGIQSGNREWRVIQVVTLDADGSEVMSSKFGAIGASPIEWDLLGEQVLVNFEHTIVIYRLDGTVAKVLRKGASSARSYRHVLVSPDSSTIVFAEFGDPTCGGACVVFATADGTELIRVAQTAPALSSAIGGYPQPSAWRDSESVLVRGQQSGEGFRGIGTLRLTGIFEAHDVEPDGRVSPSGDLLLRLTDSPPQWPVDEPGCGFRTRLDIADIDSAATIAESVGPDSAIISSRWSPDSSKILFARRAVPDPDDGSCFNQFQEWSRSPGSWWVLDLTTGTESSVGEPDSVLDAWYARPYASLGCNHGNVQVTVDTNAREYTECVDDDGTNFEVDVTLDGEVITSGRFTRLLGLLP